MNCYLQNYTTYQSTSFSDDIIQGINKNPRIMKILPLHQRYICIKFVILE